MLQSLLQPRYSNPLAVRHERRRQDKRRRPSQLALQLGRTGNSPSPTPSPSGHGYHVFYFCSKVAVLHAVVGSLLLGIVVMVVGLVQLSPGAEAAQHRYYLMGTGGVLIGAGLACAMLRCLCLHLYDRKMHPVTVEAQGTPRAAPAAAVPAHHHVKNGVENEKPVRSALRSQTSITSPRQDTLDCHKPGYPRET